MSGTSNQFWVNEFLPYVNSAVQGEVDNLQTQIDNLGSIITYDTDSITGEFTNGTDTSPTKTVNVIKINDVVTVMVPANLLSVTAGTPSFIFNAAIPAEYRPDSGTAVQKLLNVLDNSVNYIGYCTIDDGGNITVWRDIDQSTLWSNNFVGWGDTYGITYRVD